MDWGNWEMGVYGVSRGLGYGVIFSFLFGAVVDLFNGVVEILRVCWFAIKKVYKQFCNKNKVKV